MMDGKKKKYNQLLKKDTFHLISLPQTVAVAQLVRASDCGSEGRGFETHQLPIQTRSKIVPGLTFLTTSSARVKYWQTGC